MSFKYINPRDCNVCFVVYSRVKRIIVDNQNNYYWFACDYIKRDLNATSANISPQCTDASIVQILTTKIITIIVVVV